jgi:hypothetical protein
MFRVTFNVDDRKLAEALRALAGVAQAAPEVLPLVNGGAPASGSVLERLVPWLKGRKTVTAAEMSVWCKDNGMATSSRGYMLKKAKQAGILKHVGKGSGSKYLVVSK